MIHVFTKMISFAYAFVVFLLFLSEHIQVASSNYHSSMSIILDIFRKNPTPSTLICSPCLRL